MDILYSLHFSIESLSLIDPPGWIIDFTPILWANSTQSSNGKNASDDIIESVKSTSGWLFLIDSNAQILEVCPQPTPKVIYYSIARLINIELFC